MEKKGMCPMITPYYCQKFKKKFSDATNMKKVFSNSLYAYEGAKIMPCDLLANCKVWSARGTHSSCNNFWLVFCLRKISTEANFCADFPNSLVTHKVLKRVCLD